MKRGGEGLGGGGGRGERAASLITLHEVTMRCKGSERESGIIKTEVK
jgi:hypothetical protein